jgi:hypothetical protein
MRHSKRDRLLPEDINNALRLRNVEPLYGFSSAEEPLQFVKATGTNDLFYIEDRELDFNEVINGPLPPCPLDTSLTAHWLAVEGVQPAIRQNPSPEGKQTTFSLLPSPFSFSFSSRSHIPFCHALSHFLLPTSHLPLSSTFIFTLSLFLLVSLLSLFLHPLQKRKEHSVFLQRNENPPQFSKNRWK